METPERVAHYIKPNETVRIPGRHIFMHAVATNRTVRDGQVKTWGTACATFRVQPKGRKATETTVEFDTPEALWRAVSGHTAKGARTVLWAHNLGYDVRLADALHLLPRLGWHLVAHNLAPRGTWMAWERDGVSLTMVDLASVFPKLLPEVGKLFGLGFPAGTGRGESAEAAKARCRAGELIVRTAVIAYLQWIRDAGLGNWQPTGAGQSFAAFRHLHLTHSILVHEDRDALAMERRAMWTGRCEAYWHGALQRQVVHEWDFQQAYASICATHPLPVKLIGPMPPAYPWRRVLTDPKVALLAHVRVRTEVPTVPTVKDGRILWPVGEFESTLWDVEIAAALDDGAQVDVLDGYLYRTAPALKQWAEWIVAQLGADDAEVPAWRKVVLKHWSTALIGRFAMAYPQWEEVGHAPKIGVDRRTCIDLTEGATYQIMQVGRTLFREGGLVEWSQSAPAITGYVMAAMRARLWRLVSALPREAVLYVDTDSVITTDRWEPTFASIAAQEIGRGLRLKRSWDGFTIYGPRAIVTGNRVRVAGVPTSAQRIDKATFSGQVWESLAVSIGNHRPDRIVVRDRTWHVKGTDRRRKGEWLSWTQPYRVTTDT